MLYLIKSFYTLLLTHLCLASVLHSADSSKEDLRIDHKNITSAINEYLQNRPEIMDASIGKDIVIFLGNTGAGKSTLINLLTGKELQVTKLGDIILKNRDDHSAMAIGEGSSSETFLPAFIAQGDELLFDMPGFKDTRGTLNSLINACFVKRIIENAKSVKVIFVVGIDQITSDRASSLKMLIYKARKLMPNNNIDNFSGVTFTKSHLDPRNISDFIHAKLPLNEDNELTILSQWLKNLQIGHMARPEKGLVNIEERESTIEMIKSLNAERVSEVNTDVIFDLNEQGAIMSIYNLEIESIINSLLAPYQQNFKSDNIIFISEKKNYLLEKFPLDLHNTLEASSLIKLLRPLAKSSYEASLAHHMKFLVLSIDALVKGAEREIKELEKKAEIALREEAEHKCRQEAARRLQAENMLKNAERDLAALKAVKHAQISAEKKHTSEAKPSLQRESVASRHESYRERNACGGNVHIWQYSQTRKNYNGTLWEDFHWCTKCHNNITNSRPLDSVYMNPYEHYMSLR